MQNDNVPETAEKLNEISIALNHVHSASPGIGRRKANSRKMKEMELGGRKTF